MNTSPEPTAGPPGQAAQSVASVQKKVDSARALVIRLLQDLVVVEAQVARTAPAVLREANERLVLSSLQCQAEVEEAGRALEALSRSVGHDPLTQLPNRALLIDRCVHAMARARRHGSRLALLFLDLDRFKPVNDVLGHALGDQVLQAVAQRLASTVREADTVSRYGGDEFLILLGEVSRPADAEQIASKLIAVVAEPYQVGGHALQLSASVGISLYPDDGDDIEQLIATADAAMYRAKRQGPGHYALHSPASPAARARSSLPLELSRPGTLTADRLHADLREANEQLVLAAVGAQELQATAERVRKRQEELLACMALELKDSLRPVRLATAMRGRARDDEPLSPRVQSIIAQQSRHIGRMVDAVRDVARAEAGELELDMENVDLAAIVDAALPDCRASMAWRRQRFDLQSTGGPVLLRGDRARLTLVVGNLLDNASKYTADGGQIRLALEVSDAAAVLTVGDNGLGITAQALPTIFEPFAPDPQALRFNGVGRGLGLAVVRALVQAHGGTVQAHSAGQGQGSRFVVTLPRPLNGSTPTARAAAGEGEPR